MGDSHQPLHAAALFTTHRFRGDDHGGNYLEIEHRWNLHAFWDEQVSNDEPYETLRVLATDLGQNRRLVKQAQMAAEKLEADQWIDESYDLAKRYAYTKEVLQKVAAREGHTHLGSLDLSAEYKAEAETVAERRAAEAGYRLAAALQQALQ